MTDKPKHPGGRPTKFCKATADRIIERTIAKESLTSICEPDNMPSCRTVYTWLAKNKEFLHDYAKAKEIRAHQYADEIVDIAEEEPTMTIVDEKGNETTRLDPAGVNRNRLRVDTRKWIASKVLPRDYGEKQEVELSGPGGAPIAAQLDLDPETKKALREWAKANGRKTAGGG